MNADQAQIQRDDTVNIGKIAYMVEDMHHRLFGNGQPGELDRIAVRLNVMDEEIEEIKRDKARAKGAIWALSALFTALGGGQLWHIFSKK